MLPAVIAILSPHLDDAVLSCWHVLAGPGQVAVVNVFAGVPPAGAPVGWWDRLSGDADGPSVVEARRAEDRAALALAGREPVNLDFLDRQYRPDAQPPPALADALRERLPAGAVVLAPGAVTPLPDGAVEEPAEPHPDHLAVREAALALRADGFEVELYADLPHASAGGRGRLVAPDGADVHDLTDGAFAAKLRAVRRYASQIDALARAFGGRLDDSALLGREARWTP
jgi:LmbE family N-acetylglucosaminyl deacetylase